MKKLFIYLGGLLAFLFTLTIVAVFYLLSLNPNENKEWISATFYQQTGRNLSLQGDINLTLYPWLGLELNQVSVSNAPGFGDEPILYIERALIRLKLMPALSQRYEVDTVLLLGSKFNLTIDETGQDNWSGMLKISETSELADSSTQGSSPANIVLGGVDIQNASLTFDNRATDRHLEISNLTMKTGELVYGQPIQLNFGLNARSTRPNLAAQLEFSGTVTYNLEKQLYELAPFSLSSIIAGPNVPNGSTTLTLNTALNIDLAQEIISLHGLEFDALGTHLSADINVQNILSATPIFNADLSLTGNNLALLFRIAEIDDLAEQIESMDSPAFNLSTLLDANLESGSITLSELDASLLGFTLSGKLNAQDMMSNNGTIDGELSLSNDQMGEALRVLGQNDLAEVTQTMNLSLGIQGNRSSIEISPLQLDLVLAGPKIPNSPVDFNLQANASIYPDDDSLLIDNFTINGLGLDIQGSLEAVNIRSQSEFAGSLDISPFNPRELSSQLNLSMPETSDQTTLQNVSLAASFEGSNSYIKIDNLAAIIDNSNIEGRLSITDFENPVTDFSLIIDQINADRYLPSKTGKTEATISKPSELPFENLRALNLTGDLNIGQLTILNLNISELLIAINASNEQINLSPVQANLYQGSYSGALSLDISSSTPFTSINSTLQNVALEPLMNDFMGASYVSGTSDINFTLNGSGSTFAALKEQLNGNGSIALHEGILQGVDVASVLTQVESMIQNRQLMDVRQGEETPFNDITARIDINSGEVSSDDLLILAPGFQVEGKGTLIDLNTNSINYHLLTSVDRSTASNESEAYDIGGYALPITCSGSINSPSCLPEVEDIITVALQQAVSRGLTDLLQRTLGEEDEPAPSENNEEGQETGSEDLGTELLNRALESLFR